MAVIAQWNGHTFEVGSQLIRGFTDLQVSGGCETTDKNTYKLKYKEHKYGEVPKISLTVHLNALTGVTNVWDEAMQYIDEATAGATDYFYTGGYKLIPAEMMLTKAQVTEVVMMPGRGDEWISADVQLTFEQGTKSDGSSSSGGGGGKGGKGSWLKKAVDSVVTEYKTQQNKITSWIEDAKKKTAGILAAGIGTDQNIGLAHEKAQVDAVRNSGNKTGATTGRAKADTLAGKLTKTTKNSAIK